MAILTYLKAGTAKLADQAQLQQPQETGNFCATASEPSAVARTQPFGLSAYIDSYSTRRDSRLLNALRITVRMDFRRRLSELKRGGEL